MDENLVSLYSDAAYYDLFMGAYATGDCLACYRQQISCYGEPVLELACGSGRLTIPLLKTGVDIIGLDISQEMLDFGKKKASEQDVNVTFIKSDMRNFDLGRKFNFIFIPAQSLSSLHTHDELKACFSCVRQHLTKDGRFMLELFNPSLSLLTRDSDKAYPIGDAAFEMPSSNEKVWVKCQAHYDSAAQINRIRYFYYDEKGNEIKILAFEMRQFFPQEIDALLHYNGFVIEHKYGDYDESTFSETANKQLIICRLK